MDPSKNIIIGTGDRSLTIILSKALYEKAAIFQASYRFTDRCHVGIQPGEKDSVVVTFTLKDGCKEDVSLLMKEFGNEIIDQQLRLDLEKRCGHLRELIYEHAFSPITNLEDRVKNAR